MVNLTTEQKFLMTAAGRTKASPKKTTTSIKPKSKFKWSTVLKNGEYCANYLGLFSLTLTTSIFNFIESLHEYKELDKLQAKKGYHNSHNNIYGQYYKKNNSYSNALRPSIRFSAYPYRNTISFGLPWY